MKRIIIQYTEYKSKLNIVKKLTIPTTLHHTTLHYPLDFSLGIHMEGLIWMIEINEEMSNLLVLRDGKWKGVRYDHTACIPTTSLLVVSAVAWR